MLSMGHFVFGAFRLMGQIVFGAYCLMGHNVLGPMSMGHVILGAFCLGAYRLGACHLGVCHLTTALRNQDHHGPDPLPLKGLSKMWHKTTTYD